MTNFPYSSIIEQQMKTLFDNLSEKDRRMYAAIEVSKLNHGGLKYICTLLGCSDNTVYRGKEDLLGGNIQKGRIRKAGGGRKTAHEIFPKLHDVFLNVLKDHTAGDPMDDKVQWTDLSNKEIRVEMERDGIKISKKIVAKLLKEHGFSKCRMVKTKAVGSSENRNEQFENIVKFKNKFTDNGHPVISIDTKKKSL
tara:strand:- start:302 stop:886 length:585 start_codon:yes stop_codon:yes gene_type:complete